MAGKQVERVLELVKTNLTTGMVAKLAAIEAEMADGIDLKPPRSSSYYINEIDVIADLPAIQIVPDTSDSVLNGLQHDEVDHHLIVVPHVVSYEGKTDYCAKRCYRFVRAIWELLLADRTLSDNVIEVFITDYDYRPMMSDGNGLKMEAWIHVTVKMEER